MRRIGYWALAGIAVGGVFGCAGRSGDRAREGPLTELETRDHIRRAIRTSNDGLIIIPSGHADRVYELPRLNELAQELRVLAAKCFLERTIQTIQPSTTDDRGFVNVPEGQIKYEVRVAATGEVVRVEALETGFVDPYMPKCLQGVLESKRWPANDSGVTHHAEVVYWVSLGMQPEVHTAKFKDYLRREQVSATIRGKACLRGRVPPGRYEVTGINLASREGDTIVNRIDMAGVTDSVRNCVAHVFRDVRLPRTPEGFIRPVTVAGAFDVDETGEIVAEGEQWLRLVELEERALQRRRRAELEGGDEDELVAGEDDRVGGESDAVTGSQEQPDLLEPVPSQSVSARSDADPSPEPSEVDQGRGGLKLQVKPR
jgi:hypothetical protein